MERFSNDDLARQWGFLTSGQIFFGQRWGELSHLYTADTYQVNALSPRGALEELLRVTREMDEFHTSDVNLLDVSAECVSLVKHDPILEQHARQRRGAMLSCLEAATSQKAERQARLQLRYRVKTFLDSIAPHYLGWGLQQLHDAIANNQLASIDRLLGIIASEFMGAGWSQKALHKLKQDLWGQGAFDRAWDLFSDALLRRPRAFTCMIPVETNVTRDLSLTRQGLGVCRPADLAARYPGVVFPAVFYLGGTTIVVCSVDAADPYSAALAAIRRVVDASSVLAFYDYLPLWLPREQYIVVMDGRTLLATEDMQGLLDPRYVVGRGLRLLRSTEELFSDPRMAAARARLLGVFTYSSLSKPATSQEIRFVNLWSALEALLRARSAPLDLAAIKVAIGSVHSLRYLSRLVLNLGEDCQRCGVPIEKLDGSHVDVSSESTRQTVHDIAESIFDANARAKLETACGVNTLLGYRLSSLTELLTDQNATRNCLDQHRQKVMWHIQRLYRMRNAIVHSAFATDKSLTLYSRNLHGYVSVIVAELVDYIRNSSCRDLDEAIVALQDAYSIMTSLLRTQPLTPALLADGISSAVL